MTYYKELVNHDETFRYQMLSRLKGDCEYYLGNGNKSTNALWAENEKDHIEAMKVLWNSFAEEGKPEWLSWDDILGYEAKMVKTIKEQLVAKGMKENEIDTHESDLYVLKNSISEQWLDSYEFKQNATVFRSEIGNELWFEIPFGYSEHHEKKYNI